MVELITKLALKDVLKPGVTNGQQRSSCEAEEERHSPSDGSLPDHEITLMQ
jgi:hypothetical protein